MDDLARSFFELKFEVAFMKKKANAFQDFFSSIMEKRYPGDFIRVRPWGNVGDRKNDGYLKSRRTLFQVYAPNNMSSSDCITKIYEDFNGALPHWAEHFDVWIFVHNSMQGLGPQVTAKLLELGALHSHLTLTPWGYEELRREAMQMSAHDLASLLGPPPSLRGMMDLGLQDLVPVLDHIARLPAPVEPDIRPVPANKLQVNLLSTSVETLLKAGMSKASLVRKYFALKPTLQDQIGESFKARYLELQATPTPPDDVFQELQRFAGGDHQSPGQQCAVLAVLAFFFQECDIFERPAGLEDMP